ncbi:MAG: PQQ-binding-like beta-propeller repeat protein [Candidatus Sericytochromatia bacterium]
MKVFFYVTVGSLLGVLNACIQSPVREFFPPAAPESISRAPADIQSPNTEIEEELSSETETDQVSAAEPSMSHLPPPKITLLPQRTFASEGNPAWPPLFGEDGRSYIFAGPRLYVFSAQGQQEKETILPASIIGPPQLSPLGLLITDRASDIAIYDLYGQQRWRRSNISITRLNPLRYLDADTLVVSDLGQGVLGLNAEGKPKWVFLGENIVGRVPTAGKNGLLYAFVLPNHLYALSPETGEMKWLYQASGPLTDLPPIFDEKGTVYFSTHNGYIHAIDKHGFQAWSHVARDENFDLALAVGPKRVIYAISRTGQLSALSRDSGKILWKRQLPNNPLTSPAIGQDGRIYLAINGPELYVLSAQGELEWQHTFDKGLTITGVKLDKQGLLHVTGSTGQWLRFQTPSLAY